MSDVLYEKREGGAWITLNRPDQLNCLTPSMVDAINDMLSDAQADPEVMVIVVAANGRAFCAGADLKFLNDLPVEERERANAVSLQQATNMMRRLETIPKPVIAAVNGVATAGGMEILLCCDLVIAVESARMADGHSNFGLLPGAGASARLPRKVGVTRAKYLFFTGDFMSAAEMHVAGLVNQVVPDGDLHAAIEMLVSKIAGKSPLGLRRMKQLAGETLDLSIDQALRLEQTVNELHTVSFDRNEGIAAFNERRKPAFQGR